MNNTITLKSFEDTFQYLLDNNRDLVKEGKNPIAVGLEAEAGIGKTSIIEQVAKKRGMTYTKVSLAQLEEVGDLCGLPVQMFYVKKGEKGGWVSEKALQTFTNKGYSVTNRSKMSYATPEWLPDSNPNGCILNLDDFSRAPQVFLQAVMELINTGKYGTWKLPENTTVTLTSNPDNGDYSVTALDNAQRTRYVNFNVVFDINDWAAWAEGYELDDRAINFALRYPEIFDKKDSNGNRVVNPRSYVTFCNAISGISDWSKPKSLATILTISKGCFNDADNTVGTLFTTFIRNGLDKLITTKDLVFGAWESTRQKMLDCVYKDGEYRPEIGAVLATRLLNFAIHHFEEGKKTEPIQRRLIDIVSCSPYLFTEDIIFHVVRYIVTNYRNRANVLMMDSRITSKLLA